MIMNFDLARYCKESVVVYFKELSRHLLKKAEKNAIMAKRPC
jgi:hypothetical protein